MALHMADNGYYGIKIHPKKNGDEIIVDSLKAVLAQYGEVKLFQLPNKYLAFAYYEQHEEARACLNSMRTSQDYTATPGWPKQTTADEKSKNTFKPSMKEESKENADIIVTKKYDEKETSNKAEKPLKKTEIEENNNEKSSEKNKSPEEQKSKILKGKIKFDVNNDKMNLDEDNCLQLNEKNKNENQKNNENSQKDKKENKFTKNLKQIINEINVLNLEKERLKKCEHEDTKMNSANENAAKLRRSRSECRKEIKAENQFLPKNKKNRHHSVDKANNRCNKKSTKNKDNFKNHSQKEKVQNKKDATNNLKKANVTAQTEQSKSSVEPVLCCLVPVIDIWLAENIKYHKKTKIASYAVILNLPIVIDAGMIYDLCKSFVSVIYIDVKYPDNIYLPPHAFVYTQSKDDAKLLKSVLDGRRLKTKMLLVKTEEELEKS